MAVAFFALVVVLAAGFAFLNGFRDVSTAVALSVRTRALTPSVAVVLAAVFNFAGVLLSGGFALVFSQSWVVLPSGMNGLTMLAAGLCSAILWGIYAWWRGVPLSSTHALVGGLVGAGAASAVMGGSSINGVDGILLAQVVLPLLLSPVIAFLGAYLLVWPVTWAARYTQPDVVHGRFRHAQSVSAAAVAFGHGLQDGQRTVAVILLGAVAAGVSDSNDLPFWVILLTAVMLTAGTLLWWLAHLVHLGLQADPGRPDAGIHRPEPDLADVVHRRHRLPPAAFHHAHCDVGGAGCGNQPELFRHQPADGAADPGVLGRDADRHRRRGVRPWAGALAAVALSFERVVQARKSPTAAVPPR